MGYVVQAIYEGGVLRPLEKLDLSERQQVRITVEADANAKSPNEGHQDQSDPLEGIRSATGIPDLAEHFEEYRFGGRKP